MNYITDPIFQNIARVTQCENDNVLLSPNWWIKTTDSNGRIKCVATKEQGLRIDALYEGLGYLYVRQEIPNVMQFSGKDYVLKATVDRDSWQELDYDVYIQAKLDYEGADRVLVIDTHSAKLDRGTNNIVLPIHVPDLSNYIATQGNGLQVAIRFIGENQNTKLYVNSFTLDGTDDSNGITLTQKQLDAIYATLKETYVV